MQATKHLKKYTFNALMAPLFKMLEAIFELLVPLVIADIIDIGIKNHDLTYIYKKGLILIIFAFAGLLCTTIAQYFASKVATGYTLELKSNLFQHIQNLSVTDYEKLSPSSLIIRLTNDANQVQSGLNLALRLLLRSPMIVFGAFVMAFRIDRKLSLTFLITIIVLTIIVFAIMLLSIPLFAKVQNNQDILAGQTRENIIGIRPLRAFNQQNKEKQQFTDNNNHLKNIQLKTNRLTSLLNPLTYVLINIGIILVLYQSGLEINIGNLTSGKALALYNYMSQILVELIKMANLIIQINKSVACLKRIDSILSIPEKKQSQEIKEIKEYPDIIQFCNVSFHFPDTSVDCLKDINFTLKKGSITGIIGPTGSGKSTLINLLNNYYLPNDGQILLNNIPLQKLNDNQIHNLIALVPQNPTLFKGTIRSNMLFGNPDASDEMIIQALKKAQCNFIEKAEDLDREVSQGGTNFSGGQKQRLTIARGIIKHAPILILDDSSSALDYVTEKNLRQSLQQLTDTTIIIISQRISSISFCDQILVFDDGKLVGKGNHQQLMDDCPLYQEIYNSQHRKENENA
ncbi:MAG: ABC transporter ATP-binding protein [Erysipelotrichia bacterium]|nr:ABC transporter ATP-binding protein [Erysipelotrichia bacterium]